MDKDQAGAERHGTDHPATTQAVSGAATTQAGTGTVCSDSACQRTIMPISLGHGFQTLNCSVHRSASDSSLHE